ncbi:Ig-like domain-containing protein [Mesorhizobium sp. LjNodule214]|uniref:Ig-like domain-containing protein n=1 Tax=Mesorhizobium sp. LjNodule214 TaxID=3342252 RepID=UPI003ECD8EEA
MIGSADPNVAVRLYADGVLLGTTTSDESGAWSFTTLELAEDSYSFTAETGEGSDLQGSDPFEITIDSVTAAPEITSINPAESGLQLVGTAEAGASIDIYRDGTLLGIVTATASGLWEYLDTSYGGGSVAYSATATDAAGNTAETAADYAYSPPNEAPVLDLDGSADGTGYNVTFTAGGAPVAIADTDAVISDGDDTHISGATVTLTNPQAGDELIVNSADLPAGIAIDPASTSTTIILTGSASLADYEAALRQALFNNASEDPSAETRTIEVAVNDGEASSNIAVTSIAVDSALATTLTTSSTPIIFETRVAAAGDDVEERASGSISSNVSDLELGYDGSRAQTVGLRFTGIDIPPGAIITGAYIQFQADEVKTGTVSLSIRGEDADDAAAFTTAKFNVSSRLTTDAAVAWEPADWTIGGEAGPAQRTPDLATIIQEIIDRLGWAAFNDMVFLVTGTGTRTAESFEGSAAGAPLLHIEYYVPLSSDPVVFNTPADTDAAANQIAELAAAGTQVGIAASASDPDAGYTVTYSLNDPRFAIDPNTGVITRSGTGIIDFETETSITLTVKATSSDRSSATQSYTLNILDSPESVAFNIPADADPDTNRINQDAAEGTNVGVTASATDPDAGSTVSYSLNDNRFSISTNGVITRSGTGTLDAQNESSITFTVTATSSDGSSDTESFNVSVTTSTNNQLPTSVTLVHTILTSQWSPSSPDPSGIAYISHLGTLLVSDGEVDEMSIFTGKNLFEMSLSGELVRPLTTIGFSDEPCGLAYNPANRHLFFTDDTGTKAVYELNPGSDGLYDTSDDIVTSFKTSAFGSSDPEGIAYDTNRGVLYIADGAAKLHTIDPGVNGKFDGVPSVGGDDVVTSFSMGSLTNGDPCVEYDSVRDLLYIITSRTAVSMVTPTGELLGTLDISAADARKPAGLALAPSSEDPSQMSLYIVDRAVDNDSNPNENDGKVYEFMFDKWLLA